MGRPSSYTQEIGDAICRMIAEGYSLRAICEKPSMPNRDSVRRWLHADERFHGQYARAREEQAHVIMDEVLEIADMAEDKDSAAAARVRVEARFKLAALLAPKVFGPTQRIDMNVSHDIAGLIEAGRKRVRGEAEPHTIAGDTDVR